VANTYIQIVSTILSSNQTTVTLSSIPQTYTDLYIVVQTRTSDTGTFGNHDMIVNGGGRRGRWIVYNNATASAASYTNYGGETAGNALSSGIFGQSNYYIPNYTNAATNKIVSSNIASIGPTANDSWLEAIAGLSLNTAAVTSITFTPGSGTGQYLPGSLFQIYGIIRGTA
jgi:hypothetical protein